MGGWWDVFRRGQLADWHAARGAGGAPQRLILDATDHQWDPFRPDGGRAADPLADPAQMERFLPHYLDDVVAFLDDALGIRSAPAAPVRFRVAGGGWHEAPEWPPPGARDLVLHLADGARATADAQGGALAVAPDAARHTVRWTHDPADLVPTLDADVWRPLLELPDELAVEARADVLTFTAEPVSDPLVLCGGVEAILDAGAERPGAHVTAKLVDVSPHGSARRIAQGIRVLGSAAPDAPVVVDLGPTAYRLAPGHRLRLEVAASDFPRYLPAFDPGADPWHATAGRPAEQHLRTGGPDGSRLRMSVLT
jgi:putative CocE/NonD family hydrolase